MMRKAAGSVKGGRGTDTIRFPRVPPFTLGVSADGTGARIYKGRFIWSVAVLDFEKKYIETESGTEEVNSLAGQDAISKPSVEIPGLMDNSAPAEEEDFPSDWFDLGSFGNVYIQWQLDPETGEVSGVDIVIGEEPDGAEIPVLDSNLSRGEEIGEGGEGSTGVAGLFYAKIGEVKEDGTITQNINSDFYWYHTLIPSNAPSSESSESSSSESSSSSSSSESSSESSSAPSSSGSSGESSEPSEDSSGSSKSSAIVPTDLVETGYVALLTMEAPEVLFFDVQRVPLNGSILEYMISPIFLDVCVPGSVRVVGHTTNRPSMIGAEVKGNVAAFEIMHLPDMTPPSLMDFMLVGTRKGFKDVRFPLRDAEQFEKNERRINSAYPAKDFSHLKK